MNWIEALKAWNAKKGGKYTVPKKGSKGHAQVLKLMKGGKILSGATAPITYKKKGGALNRDYAIKVGTKLLQQKGVQPTEETAIAEAERDMDEKFKKASQRGLEKEKTRPKRKYVKRVGRKILGGSLKAKEPVVIDGIMQYTEKKDRMKGGNFFSNFLDNGQTAAFKKYAKQYGISPAQMKGGSMKKELQVIAGKPQYINVRGGGGFRLGESEPKLYGLKMFGQ